MAAPAQPTPIIKCKRCGAVLAQMGQPVMRMAFGEESWSVELRCPNARTHSAAACWDQIRGLRDHDDYRYAWISGAWRPVVRLGWK